MLTLRRQRLIIDAKPLVDDHFSGIGHYAMSLLQALDSLLEHAPAGAAPIDVRLAVPFDRVARLRRFGFTRIRPQRLPLPYDVLKRLSEEGRLPSMDRVCGRGTYFFPNYLRWPLASSRSITAVHDLAFDKVPGSVDGPNARFLRREVANSVARSDRISALSHTMADEIAEHYDIDRDRLVVVGCAADLRRFYRRSSREIAEVTRRHGVFGRYLLSVGNIEPRKNQIRLIDAFSALPPEVRAGLTLVLVGAGAWNETLIRARVDAAHRDGVKVRLLLGAVPDADIAALYSGAECSVYASVYEGFGMPPLESMACQTPVIASNASVMPEVCGDAAEYVDPQRTAALTNALSTVLTMDDETRAAMVTRGLANVDRYDWQDAARALLATVTSIGSDPSGGR